MNSIERVKLQNWLQVRYPSDVLIAIDGKAPIHPFADSKWGWSQFEYHLREDCDKDFALLAKGLCVIDFDNAELATTFEWRFPILKQVPMQKTKRGCHYFFERSELADIGGYFHGSSQVESKVDFLTVCSTGSPGVVVMAPSEGKQWVRPLWTYDSMLMAIPDELLAAVAKPKFDSPSLEFHITFEDGSRLACDKTLLASFSIFEPMVDYEQESIHLSCGCASDMQQILHLHKYGELPMYLLVGSQDVSKLAAFADYIGSPKTMMRYLLLGLRYRRMLAGVWPEMLQALVDDGVCYAEGELIDITTNNFMAARSVQRSDLVRCNLLMDQFPEACAYTRPSALMIDNPEAYVGRMPNCVLNALKIGRGKIALAGGAALGILSASHFRAGRDYDLFLFGVSTEEADTLLQSVMKEVGGRAFITPNTVTMLYAEKGVEVQVILRIYDTLKDVLRSFDLSCSRVALYVDENIKLRAVATPGWFVSIKNQLLWPDPMQHSNTYPSRLLKYYTKGFDILALASGRIDPNTGFDQLLHMTEDMMWRRERMSGDKRRPMRVDLRHAIKATARDEYAGFGIYKMSNRFVQKLMSAIGTFMDWWSPLTSANVTQRIKWSVHGKGTISRDCTHEWDLWEGLVAERVITKEIV